MNRNTAPRERGQALILIVFAILGLVGITGLAVDGGMAYNDRRNAQTVADNSALAAALAGFRNRDAVAVAKASALRGGFNDDGVRNSVQVTVKNLVLGVCPNETLGTDVTVQITSHLRTYFAPVLGIRQLTNVVTATARACGQHLGPLFNGNAIVALAPGGIGFDAAGNPRWTVAGGGIFSNSADSPSARCKGASDVSAPSLTTVGGVELKCSTTVGTTSTGATQYKYDDYSALLPQPPTCNGKAQKSGPFWTAQLGADGSKVAFNGDMRFAPGLYCVTNSPGPFHGNITGNFVTFYLIPANFSMKLSGGGTFTATAPLYGEYAGVLMFSDAHLSGGVLQQTQSIDLRGNGNGDITGSIIVPSANVTMFGNSNGMALQTQVIGYHVDSGGTADINVNYQATKGYQAFFPAWLTLLK